MSTPTSATGIWTRADRTPSLGRGFSLLELLVVVTIIGIFAGIAVLSMGVAGPDRELEREAQRLGSLVDLLREEALMQTRDYGILFSATGYRFYVYDYQLLAWVAPPADRLVEEHALPQRLDLALTLEGRELALDRSFAEEPPEGPEPQVAILSSGELTPFDVAFRRDGQTGRYNVSAGADGSIEITRHDFQAP